jgi:hypothetical protein
MRIIVSDCKLVLLDCTVLFAVLVSLAAVYSIRSEPCAQLKALSIRPSLNIICNESPHTLLIRPIVLVCISCVYRV